MSVSYQAKRGLAHTDGRQGTFQIAGHFRSIQCGNEKQENKGTDEAAGNSLHSRALLRAVTRGGIAHELHKHDKTLKSYITTS